MYDSASASYDGAVGSYVAVYSVHLSGRGGKRERRRVVSFAGRCFVLPVGDCCYRTYISCFAMIAFVCPGDEKTCCDDEILYVHRMIEYAMVCIPRGTRGLVAAVVAFRSPSLILSSYCRRSLLKSSAHHSSNMYAEFFENYFS